MTWTHPFQRLLATRSDRLITAVTAVLLFAAGYLAGFWAAETRKEVPIVFEAATGTGTDVLTSEDLKKLTIPPSPERAGRDGQQSVAPSSARQSSGGAYVASTQGTKYYMPECPEVRRIKEENLISFASEQEAKDAGYEPSSCVARQRGANGAP